MQTVLWDRVQELIYLEPTYDSPSLEAARLLAHVILDQAIT